MRELPTDRLAADVEALAGMPRGSASREEQDAARWAAARLEECGAAGAGVERYRSRATNSWSFAGHSAVALAGQLSGGLMGAGAALLALVSLERDASGRFPWRWRLLGGSEGASAFGRIPASGERRGTVVIVAHIDTAKTGLAWHPRVTQFGAQRNLSKRRMEPVMGLQALAIAASALAALLPRRSPVRRLVGLPAAALNLLAIALNLDIARSPAVPGANDNASGVAAALALTRAFAAQPPRNVDLEIALVGGEESGMGGFNAWLERRNAALDPSRTLVIGIDTVGSGTPIVAEAEGAMATHRYPEGALELVEQGARLAGEPEPGRWRIGGWTDPLVAAGRGIPATCILSVGPGYYTHYHHPSDLPEFVDYDCVAACARIAAGTVEAWDRRFAG
jgi:acetylornithine deacetylase/succinyl-diaminopimelate desuccinylase-like protein